jgi:hydroxymethylpyrimidine pyrophosphatase-like HAD family hydrolase
MPGVFLQGLLVADAQGRTLWSRSLEEEAVLAAIRLAKSLHATLTCYCGDRIVAERLDEHTDRLLFYKEPVTEALGDLELLLAQGKLPSVQKVIFMASKERAAAFRAEVEAAFSGGGGGGSGDGAASSTGPQGSVTTALPGMVELLPFGASKGAGLQWLLDNALPTEVERRWRREQEERAGAGAEASVIPGLMAMGDGENDREMLAMAEWGVAMGNAGEALKRSAQAVVSSNTDDGVAEAIERFVLAPRRKAGMGVEEQQPRGVMSV